MTTDIQKIFPAKTVLLALLMAALYYVTGKWGLTMAVPPGYATFIWPPSGIAIGMLIMQGRNLWPGVFLGSLLVNLTLPGDIHEPIKILIAAGIAAGSTAQAIGGWYLVQRFIGLPINLQYIRDTFKLFMLTGPVGCLIAATVGTAILYAAGVVPHHAMVSHWGTWWAGDALGVLVFMPFILLGIGQRDKLRWRGQALGTLPFLAMLMLMVPLGTTFYLWKASSEYLYEKNKRAFEALANESEKALLFRLQSYQQIIIGGVGFFQGSQNVTYGEWKAYAQSLDAQRRFPGIKGIGFIANVQKDQEKEFVRSVRADGSPDFKIHPDVEGDDRFIITYIEPEESNKVAKGLNLAYDDARHQAALLSRDTGEAAITRKISLVQDEKERPAFLILQPFYKGGAVPKTVEERREQLAGWIYGPIINHEFLDDLTESQMEMLSLQVFYTGASAQDSFIYDSRNKAEVRESDKNYFEIKKEINLLQQNWTIIWRSTPEFDRLSTSYQPLYILCAGLSFTSLFGLFLIMISQRADTVKRMVNSQTQEIQYNEQKMRLLIKNTPAAVAMFDKNLCYIMASDRWIKDYNLQSRDIIGRSHYEIFPEILKMPEWLEFHRRALSGEILTREEDEWQRQDGKTDWVKWALHPWMTSENDIGGIVMFTEVITERKEFEIREKDLMTKVLKSDGLNRAILSSTAYIVIATDIHGKIIVFNRQAERSLGYKASDVIDHFNLSVFHDADEILNRARMLPAKVSGFNVLIHKVNEQGFEEREWTYVRKDGSRFPVKLTMTALEGEHHETVGYLGVVEDITIWRRQQEFLELTLTATQDGVWDWDPETSQLWLSPRWKAMFGYEDHEIPNSLEGAEMVIFRDDLLQWRQGISDYIEGRSQEFAGIYRFNHKDGELRYVLSRAKLAKDGQGKVTRIVGAHTDITYLEKAKADAMRANNAKSEFLANMSHEIRTPMNGIMGMTQLVMGSVLSPQQRHYVEYIYSSADSLLQIINDILDISKIESGKFSIEHIQFSLRDVCEEIADTIALKMDGERVEFILRFDPESRDCLIGDPLRIRQLVINLCGNAAKFTEKGHVYLDVSTQDLEGGVVEVGLSVQDTGIGIARDRQEEIFEKFDQGDTSTARQFGGTGLGLAIAKQIAEAMDGGIKVESEIGKGTAFHCQVQVMRSSQDENADLYRNEFSSLHRRSLIIDDNPVHGAVLSGLLTYCGHRVDVCADVDAALLMMGAAQGAKSGYQYIFVDDKLPGLRGIDAAACIINQKNSVVPNIILLGGHELYTDIDRAQGAGIKAFLSKPLHNGEVVNMLRVLEDGGDQDSRIITRYSLKDNVEEKSKTNLPDFQDIEVLLAEDNVVNQSVFVAMMKAVGVRVRIAAGGQEALDALMKNHYDLIFMDCQMPLMDGFETTRRIREYQRNSGRRSTVIALTANALAGDQQKCLNAGMDDYLAKPFFMTDLQDMLRKWIQKEGDVAGEVIQIPQRPVSQIINLARLDAIRSLGDDAFTHVIDLFIANAAQIVVNIRGALGRLDYKDMMESAHSLKSICAQVGASDVADDVEHLEVVCRDYRGVGVDIIVVNIEAGLKRVIQELQKMRDE